MITIGGLSATMSLRKMGIGLLVMLSHVVVSCGSSTQIKQTLIPIAAESGDASGKTNNGDNVAAPPVATPAPELKLSKTKWDGKSLRGTSDYFVIAID